FLPFGWSFLTMPIAPPFVGLGHVLQLPPCLGRELNARGLRTLAQVLGSDTMNWSLDPACSRAMSWWRTGSGPAWWTGSSNPGAVGSYHSGAVAEHRAEDRLVRRESDVGGHVEGERLPLEDSASVSEVADDDDALVLVLTEIGRDRWVEHDEPGEGTVEPLRE